MIYPTMVKLIIMKLILAQLPMKNQLKLKLTITNLTMVNLTHI
jgi:hypothetical protein